MDMIKFEGCVDDESIDEYISVWVFQGVDIIIIWARYHGVQSQTKKKKKKKML